MLYYDKMTCHCRVDYIISNILHTKSHTLMSLTQDNIHATHGTLIKLCSLTCMWCEQNKNVATLRARITKRESLGTLSVVCVVYTGHVECIKLQLHTMFVQSDDYIELVHAAFAHSKRKSHLIG